MAETMKNILIYNGDRRDQTTSVKAKDVASLRKELKIPVKEVISVNGRKAGEELVINDGDVVAWALGNKTGG